MLEYMFQCLNTRINLKELNTKNVTPNCNTKESAEHVN